MANKKPLWIGYGILTAALLTCFLLLGWRTGFSFTALWDMLAGMPLLGIAIILGLYAMKTAVWFIPLAAIWFGTGTLYDTGWAVVMTYAGLTLELSIGYFFGRYLGKEYILALLNRYKAGKWVLKFAERNVIAASCISRMLPGPPLEVTNMFLSSLRIRYWQFLLASLLGLTPGILPAILAGKAASDPLSKDFLVPAGIGLIIAVIPTLSYTLWQRHKKKLSEKE